MTKKWINTKFIAAIITVAIVVVIFFSGPASAIKLAISIPEKIILLGSNINIMPSVEIQNLELAQIDYLELKLNGPNSKNINCRFFPNGTIISGCKDITIKQILVPENQSNFGYGYGYRYTDSLGYGYGYGYFRGLLKYNITIDSDDLSVGNYSTELRVIIGDKSFSFAGETITITKINPPKLLSKRCSIRAFDGSFNVDNKDFFNNRLKFYISERDNNTIIGTGSLSGQKDRDRFTYRFKIAQVIDNSETKLVFNVTGMYRIGRDKNIPVSAILNYDRINNKIIVTSDKVNIKSMIINFIEGCDSI